MYAPPSEEDAWDAQRLSNNDSNLGSWGGSARLGGWTEDTCNLLDAGL